MGMDKDVSELRVGKSHPTLQILRFVTNIGA